MSRLRVTEEKVKVIKRFVLDMSEEEAATLFVILERIGGSPDHSPRGLTADIRRQLVHHIDKKLLNHIESCLVSRDVQSRGTIHFRDNSWDMTREDD